MLGAGLEAKRRNIRIFGFVLSEISERDNSSAGVQRSPQGRGISSI